MNNTRYRIVFNEARGQLMAVAETIVAHRRPGATGSRCRRAGSRSVFARAVSAGITLALSSLACAQIVAYRHAPAAQQPTILATGNGVPLVNIRTPSAAGVSHNAYSQFDVAGNGAILNNARNATATRLAGWVAGNPWLATGSARLIVNEVFSSDPSRLQGYLEVAGNSAQVVVANPAGISCSGCGFINAQRITLTTGTPLLSAGQLDGYRVERGTLRVEGAGLDAGDADYADLIARTVAINAALWAKTLTVSAGANTVSAEHATGQPIAAAPPGGNPTGGSIDVALLGGMYAGKITLIGSEAGVGVRNAGQIAASAGDVVVTIDGRILNSGQITSSGQTRIEAAALDNGGTIHAQGDTLVTTRGDLDNSGTISAQGDTTLSASGATSRLSGSAGALFAAGLGAPDHTVAHLSLSAGAQIAVHGQAYASGAQTLTAATVDVSEARLAATTLNLAATDGDLDARRATLIASGTLDARAAGDLRHDQASSQAQQLQLSAAALSNAAGALVQNGAGSTTIALSGRFDNRLGLLAGDGEMRVSAGEIDNRGGTLRAGRALTVTSSGPVDNAGGLVSSAVDLELIDPQASAADRATKPTLTLNNTAGTLFAERRLTIVGAALGGDGSVLSRGELSVSLHADFVNSGEFAATGKATLTTSGALSNRALLQSGELLQLGATSIDNAASGRIVATTLNLATPGVLTNRGLIDGGEALLEAERIDNLGSGRIYGDRLAIAAPTLNNAAEDLAAPVIAARQALDIGTATIVNSEHALIFSAGDLSIGGALDANRRAAGRAQALDNVSATIEAQGSLSIAAERIANTNAHLATAVDSLPEQRIVEYQGSGATVRYAPGTPGVYIHNDESDQLMTPEGNYESWLAYDYARSTRETRLVRSDPGRLLATGDIRLSAGSLTNDDSQIIAGGTLNASVDTLSNNETPGERAISDTGTVTSYWRNHRKGRDDTGSSVATYTPPPTIETITLGTRVFRQNGDAASGAAAPPAFALGIVEVRAADPAQRVRSISPDLTLPDSSLFRTLPPAAGPYLVETDPQFTSFRQWLSSDYLLGHYAATPELTQKRLGDGYYEQRLIREQLAQLTGQRLLAGYTDDEAQYRALMDAAATYAQRWQLRPGVALSAQQMAQLTSDVVWLVEREVVLADGTTQRVLVPQLYVRVRDADLAPGGALIAGNDILLESGGDVVNGATIAGRELVALSAENVANLGGRIAARHLEVAASQDLANLGGSLYGEDQLIARAGRDLVVSSTTGHVATGSGDRTAIDRLAGLYVSGENATLIASAGRDLQLTAARIDAGGPSAQTALLAGRDLTLESVRESTNQSVVWDAQNTRRESSRSDIGSTVHGDGDIVLRAGNDLKAVAARIDSSHGTLAVLAGNDLDLRSGTSEILVDEAHQHSERGLLSRTTRSTRDRVEASGAIASTLSAETTTLDAGRDLRLTGSDVVASGDTTLRAGKDVAIEAASLVHNESHFREVSKSGVFSSGGIGFTVGRQQLSVDQTTESTRARASTVGSLDGELVIEAGAAYRQVGSNLIAAQGDIAVAAARIDILDARETQRSVVDTRFKQSGLSVGVSSPLITAVQSVQQMRDAIDATDDARMQLLAVASSALAVDSAVSRVGATIRQFQAEPAGGKTQPSQGIAGIDLNLSLGSSSSQSTATQTAERSAVSQLVAGRDIALTARGLDHPGDLTLRAARVLAGRDITLVADGDVALTAAPDNAQQHSSSQGHSASVGVSIGTGGLRFNLGASTLRGHGDGDQTTWRNSQIEAGRNLTLVSGGDAALRGAVARGEQIAAAVGGDLTIASLQDTRRYDQQQRSAGFTLSIGMGQVGGSIASGRSTIDSDYASVIERSGFQAGDGGFQIDVQGNTELQGGVIASTATAVDYGRNRLDSGGALTLSDIANHADYRGDAYNANLGQSVNFSGKFEPGDLGTSAGVGHTGASADSVSRAGISGIAGERAVRSGDASGALADTFDAAKVQREIDAQVQITQTFGRYASQLIGDYAAGQLKQASELYIQARSETDVARKSELETQAQALEARWGDQGTLRLVAHTLIGGLTGGTSGAVGAAAGTISAPLVTAQLQSAGIDGPLAKTLTALASTFSGALFGGTAGAGTALNETANNYLYHYKGKIIAFDTNDNDRIIMLSDDDLLRLIAQNPRIVAKEKLIGLSDGDLRQLAAQYPEAYTQIVAAAGLPDLPIRVLDTSSTNMNGSRILDLNDAQDRDQIAKEADMGYLNLSDAQTRIYVQTGIDNARVDATASARALGALLAQPVGYINNGTEGLSNDVGEYLPSSLGLKDVLNEYTLRTLDAKGPTLIVLHSAGNEDARKALLAGSLYDHHYPNLSFVSLGSPVGSSAMQAAVTQGQATYLGQVADWRDPVTYSKTAGAIGIVSLLGGAISGISYGATYGCATGAGVGPFGCLFAGGTGAGIGLAVGSLAGIVPFFVEYKALTTYHPFEQYIAKPQTQSILFDWLRANPAASAER